MFGEDEDWLWDVANEMDPEDGLIWVYGPGNDGVMAFTDFGIETLTGLIEIPFSALFWRQNRLQILQMRNPMGGAQGKF